MRTILAKILVWSLGTFALSLVAYWLIERTLERHGPPGGDPFWGMVALVESDVCRAYEQGGPERLADYLERLDLKVPGEHHLTDPSGRDLASGVDRSDLLRAALSKRGSQRLPDGRVVLVGRPRDGRYRFITVVRPWFDRPSILPYYGAVVLVIAGMGAILAAHLAAPLRRLRLVVERFGHGDLSARAQTTRKDEIGELSRAFDEMADRIETLLAAERRLLQDVSHELRSPLARIGFALELARTSPDGQHALDRIQRDVGRLNQLVNELLQLNRAEGDPTALMREDVRLDQLLLGVADDCHLEASAHGCRVDVAASPAAVRGEPELLRRALENVLRNAVRHAPKGTTVEAALRQTGGTTTIAIRDYGAGVPDALLGAIFEPFFRVGGDRSRASGGVGLGLAIARRAVHLHGGTITARNAGPGLLVAMDLPHTWDASDGAGQRH